MGDVLHELAGIEGLSPKDGVLGRALIRQGLAAPERVLEAARAVVADPSGGGILDRLAASGVLSEERARSIEEALKKRIAERKAALAAEPPAGEAPAEKAGAAGESEVEDEPAADAPPKETPADGPEKAEPDEAKAAAGTPADAEPELPDIPPEEAAEAQQKSTRMWKPRRRREPPPARNTPPPPDETQAERKGKVREMIDEFVGSFVRSRLHQLTLESLARMGAGVADHKVLAKQHGVKDKEILRIFEEWHAKGLLRTVATFPFYFDPLPKQKEAVRLFFQAWNNPTEHRRLLSKILEIEG